MRPYLLMAKEDVVAILKDREEKVERLRQQMRDKEHLANARLVSRLAERERAQAEAIKKLRRENRKLKSDFRVLRKLYEYATKYKAEESISQYRRMKEKRGTEQ